MNDFMRVPEEMRDALIEGAGVLLTQLIPSESVIMAVYANMVQARGNPEQAHALVWADIRVQLKKMLDGDPPTEVDIGFVMTLLLASCMVDSMHIVMRIPKDPAKQAEMRRIIEEGGDDDEVKRRLLDLRDGP